MVMDADAPTRKRITRAELEALIADNGRLQKENVQLRRRMKQLGRLHAELYEMYKEASKNERNQINERAAPD